MKRMLLAVLVAVVVLLASSVAVNAGPKDPPDPPTILSEVIVEPVCPYLLEDTIKVQLPPGLQRGPKDPPDPPTLY